MGQRVTEKTVFIASDHAAFVAKEQLIALLPYPIVNLGPFDSSPCDYPDWAIKLVTAVLARAEHCGILLCGSGIGMSMVANRFAQIRAALCRSDEDARLAKEHNNANILCLGARVSRVEEMVSMVTTWQNAEFAGGRHEGRIGKFNFLGAKSC